MKAENKVIIWGLLLGFFYWFADAFVDVFLFHKGGDFLDVLIFDISGHEFLMRSFVFLGFVAVGFAVSRVIAERSKAEAQLRESEEMFRAVTGTARDSIVVMDDNGIVTFWNPAAEAMFGYKAEEAVGSELHSLIGPPEYYDDYYAGLKRFKATGEGKAIGKTIEMNAVDKNGSVFPVELSVSASKVKGRWHAVGIIRDISERKKAEEDLRFHRECLIETVEDRTAELRAANRQLQSEVAERKHAEEILSNSSRFYGMVFDSIRDPFAIIDRQYTIFRVNEAYCQMKGIPPENLVGQVCHKALQGRDLVCEGCVVEKTFNAGDPCAKEKRVILESGMDVWIEIYTYPIFDKDIKVSHVIEYTRDITERKKSEEEKKRLIDRLEHLSSVDSLTEILNRRALIERLNYETSRARRYGSELSVVLCDMDGFKEINDTFGHMAGDKVLKTVADTLKGPLRKADAAGRYGGDEFMLILPETSLEGAQILAERIRATVETLDFGLNGPSGKVTLSIGVTSLSDSTEGVDALIKNADIALYSSKDTGKNKVTIVKG